MSENYDNELRSRCGLEKYFLKRSEIMLYGPIDEKLTYNVITEIKHLINNNKKTITIFINSEGGDVDCCCAIIDLMEQAQIAGCKVITVGEGKCYSAAGFILAMGSPGYRYATPNSQIMLHEFNLTGDGTENVSKQASELAATNKQMNKILDMIGRATGRSTKKTLTKFKEEISKDLWLDVDEAIKYKIIDAVYPANIKCNTN